MKKYFSAYLMLLLLSSCTVFQKDSFEGDWTLKLNGAIKESFDFKIPASNEFSFAKSVSYGGRDYDVTINGKIEKDGSIRAEIIAGGQVMGEINGTLTFENGKGNWTASILSGEWTAQKK